MYVITVKGKCYKFATLEAALQAASNVFNRTGIVVGVERAA